MDKNKLFIAIGIFAAVVIVVYLVYTTVKPSTTTTTNTGTQTQGIGQTIANFFTSLNIFKPKAA